MSNNYNFENILITYLYIRITKNMYNNYNSKYINTLYF